MFSHETPYRAASVVEELYRQQPVAASVVARRLRMSTAGIRKALKTAEQFGLVEAVGGVGWLPGSIAG